MTAPTSDFTGPYRGLEPFDESAMAFFFGRERESRLITASLFASPLTLLYGVSGVGKSSVLRAGVLPELRARKSVLPVVFPRFSNSPDGRLVVERGWQTDPVSGIKETAALALFASARDEEERRRYQEVVHRHDMTPLQGALEAIAEASDRLVMVILDQFEEYSLYHPEDDELFAQQFPKAVASRNRSLAFLVSLREDALARLDRFKATIPTLWDSYRRIDHLDRSAAEDAIRKPLEEFNRRQPSGAAPVQIEDDLVKRVLAEVQTGSFQIGGETGGGTLQSPTVSSGRIETPYLQLVMTRLWEREREENSSLLRLSTLMAEGKAEQIVLTHLDRVMAQFSAPERDLAAKVFHRLVTPNGAKIAFGVGDLAAYEAVSEDALRPILQRLEEGNRRILRRVAEPGFAEPHYEIFHDRLGKAMLAWRSRYLAERDRDAAARQQAEEKRLADESQRGVSSRVNAAMDILGPKQQRIWVAVMFFLVNSKGVRQQQGLSLLTAQSRENPAAIQKVLTALIDAGILRLTSGPKAPAAEASYEIVDDVTAAALLEWHSSYIIRGDVKPSLEGSTMPPRPGGPGEFADYAKDPGPSPDPITTFPYRVVRNLLAKGDVISFLGSGVGLSASPQGRASASGSSLPSNRELKEAIARACDYPPTEFEPSDISEVASYFVQRVGRGELDKLLNDLIGSQDVPPSDTHAFLAQMAGGTPLLILTTNYDRLMETALRDAAVPFDVLAYLPDDIDRRDCVAFFRDGGPEASVAPASKILIDRDRTVVFRLHGTGDGEPNSYVITEEDQIDWILRLRGREPWLTPSVTEALANLHLLSLGHGARDWSQRALLRTLAGQKRRKSAWTVSLHPSPLSIMTWQRYDVQMFNEDLNAWTHRMREAGGDGAGNSKPEAPTKGGSGPARKKKPKKK